MSEPATITQEEWERVKAMAEKGAYFAENFGQAIGALQPVPEPESVWEDAILVRTAEELQMFLRGEGPPE